MALGWIAIFPLLLLFPVLVALRVYLCPTIKPPDTVIFNALDHDKNTMVFTYQLNLPTGTGETIMVKSW